MAFMSFIKLLSYIIPTYKICGRVAQLVEHYLDMVVVDGSSPFVATTFKELLPFFIFTYFLKKLLYSCMATSAPMYITGE